jgi:acetoin utilization protein AcuB
MSIEKIMSKHVVAVDMDTTLGAIHDIFERVKFHHVLVVEDHKLMGVISDRDILKVISPFAYTHAEQSRDSATLKKRAHQIMTRKPVTMSIDDSPMHAVQIFVEKNVSCLPVLNRDGTVAGIISWRDILKMIAATARKA